MSGRPCPPTRSSRLLRSNRPRPTTRGPAGCRAVMILRWARRPAATAVGAGGCPWMAAIVPAPPSATPARPSPRTDSPVMAAPPARAPPVRARAPPARVRWARAPRVRAQVIPGSPLRGRRTGTAPGRTAISLASCAVSLRITPMPVVPPTVIGPVRVTTGPPPRPRVALSPLVVSPTSVCSTRAPPGRTAVGPGARSRCPAGRHRPPYHRPPCRRRVCRRRVCRRTTVSGGAPVPRRPVARPGTAPLAPPVTACRTPTALGTVTEATIRRTVTGWRATRPATHRSWALIVSFRPVNRTPPGRETDRLPT